jgi:biofilm PGA synthesis N-glycosyltransferase PgaC
VNQQPRKPYRKGSGSLNRIVAIVPAYNEGRTIARTVEALLRQWAPPVDEVIVVPNNCTDDTADAARAAGATVMPYPGRNPHRKAGALNWAIDELLPGLNDRDFLLVTDADSILDPDFTAHAVRALIHPHRRRHRRVPPVGAACATFHTGRHHRDLLGRLQRNEYARFARQVHRRGGKALVLSGVATLFTVRSVRQVLAERNRRLPGYAGEFYHRDTATEDIELTFAYRALGYRPVAPRRARAQTDSMPSWRALRDQRVRWQRGMLDSLRLYGVRRFTAEDLVRQVAMYAGSVLAPAYVAFLVAAALTHGPLLFDARWLPLTLVFALERAWTVRRNPFGDIAMAAALLPEWLYEQYRSAVYWWALVKTMRGSDRVWINA